MKRDDAKTIEVLKANWSAECETALVYRDLAANEPDEKRRGVLLRMAEAVGDTATPLRTAAVAYVGKVLDEEWSAMRDGRAPEQAMPALRELALATVAPTFVARAPLSVQQAVIDAFVEIRQARMERVAVVARHGASLNWLAMLALGVLSQVAVEVVQLDRLRPQVLALLVFTSAFAATTALIGLHERPFSGTAVSDAPLRSAVSSLRP